MLLGPERLLSDPDAQFLLTVVGGLHLLALAIRAWRQSLAEMIDDLALFIASGFDSLGKIVGAYHRFRARCAEDKARLGPVSRTPSVSATMSGFPRDN